MAGSRLSVLVVVLILCGVTAAEAQPPMFSTGLLTAFVGSSRGGDVGDPTITGGASLAIIDASGFGAEFDIAHSGSFNEEFFADSSLTSFMLNFAYAYPNNRFRPFVNLGGGVLRLRASATPEQSSDGHYEAAWNAGAGLYFMLTEALAVRGDVRYFRLFERPTDFALPDNGFFDYWRPSVGVTLSWPVK